MIYHNFQPKICNNVYQNFHSGSSLLGLLYSLSYYAHLLSRSNRMKKHLLCLKFSYTVNIFSMNIIKNRSIPTDEIFSPKLLECIPKELK
jgi:hypothetical protein